MLLVLIQAQNDFDIQDGGKFIQKFIFQTENE